jgi:hypothetical protein
LADGLRSNNGVPRGVEQDRDVRDNRKPTHESLHGHWGSPLKVAAKASLAAVGFPALTINRATLLTWPGGINPFTRLLCTQAAGRGSVSFVLLTIRRVRRLTELW